MAASPRSLSPNSIPSRRTAQGGLRKSLAAALSWSRRASHSSSWEPRLLPLHIHGRVKDRSNSARGSESRGGFVVLDGYLTSCVVTNTESGHIMLQELFHKLPRRLFK